MPLPYLDSTLLGIRFRLDRAAPGRTGLVRFECRESVIAFDYREVLICRMSRRDPYSSSYLRPLFGQHALKACRLFLIPHS